MLLGLRTAIYASDNLERARDWYTEVLGFGPYFDEPFYVGFDVSGYELGLQPSDGKPAPSGVTVYWGVEDINAAHERLVSLGATAREDPVEVGEGIKVATVLDPFGNVFGVIENPHFHLKE